MISPIVLNEIGEVLVNDSPQLTDDSEICLTGGPIGYLEFSHVLMDVYRASSTHYVIHSRTGNLRIEVPLTESTFEKLRKWCAQKISGKKVRESEISIAISQTRRYG